MSWAGEPGHVPCPVVRSKAGLGYAFVNLCDPSFAGVLRSFELREFGHMATLEWIRSENSGSQEIFQQKSQHFPNISPFDPEMSIEHRGKMGGSDLRGATILEDFRRLYQMGALRHRVVVSCWTSMVVRSPARSHEHTRPRLYVHLE